jgi:hypothetical protein
MGMYTELVYNSELKTDIPKSVIDIINYMLGDRESKPETPDHELFHTTRWDFMLTCDSYYFDADTNSTLRFDEISGTYYLNIRCNFKNYDGEIDLFIDWIRPYIDKFEGELLGFYRFETSEDPTIIYS